MIDKLQTNHFSFELNDKEYKTYEKWIKKHDKTCRLLKNQGAIGGRLTFTFTPTALGIVKRIECACKEHVDVTEYEKW